MAIAQFLAEYVLLPNKELLHLASRVALDQTFTRLIREGKLMHVRCGAHAAPMISRFGVRLPPQVKMQIYRDTEVPFTHSPESVTPKAQPPIFS